MNEKDLKKLLRERDNLITALNARFESTVQDAQRGLLKDFMGKFVELLQTDENGNIAPTQYNRNLLLSVDKLFVDYGKKHNVLILATLLNSVSGVLNFNEKYYSNFQKPAELLPLKQKAIDNVRGWLGVDEDKANENGYLKTLVNSDAVRNQIKDLSMRAVYSQKGWMSLKNEMQNFIEGGDDSLGALQKYYRNYSYDLISQIDRATAKSYADDLKFEFAIYEGGLIETSRPFCKEHNGNVYHISEIAKMSPPTAKQPNYNPFTDLGGYACRHHWNYIPTSLALMLRPDAKPLVGAGVTGVKGVTPPNNEKPKPKEVEKKQPAKQVVEQKQTVKPRLIDPKTPFEEIEPFEVEPFKAPKEYEGKGVEDLMKIETERATLRERYQQEIGERNNMVDKLNSLMRRGKGKTDEYAELHKNYMVVNEKAKATKKEYTALQKKIEKDGETYFKELVAAKKTESDVAVDLSNYNPKNRNNKLDEVFDYFKKISAGYNEGTTIKVIDISGRAHYSSQYNQIHIAKSDTKFTVLHELGHSLERNNHVMKAAVDFLKRRVGNFPAEKLLYPNIKGNYERYWDGKFFNNYVGKIYKGSGYKDLRATEVISMGLEQMMRNPRLFYQQDKEHFELIYNLFFKQ